MDNVKITLQNRELIEDLINNSDNLEIAIHNAIIDGISKRTLKAVMNDTELEKKIDNVKKDAEDKIAEKYFNKEKNGWGYTTTYTLKPEYQKIIDKAVDNAFKRNLDDRVNEITKEVCKPYADRLNKVLSDWVKQIESYDIDALAKKAINEAVEKRFGKA